MLENAVRICEAKFGTLQLRENGAFRVAAMHNPPPAFAEARRRNPLIYPNARTLKQTTTDMKAAGAHRADLISRMDLRVVGDGKVES
jgi:hypothetical protein